MKHISGCVVNAKSRGREKLFGLNPRYSVPLDREQKVKLWVRAQALSHPTQRRKHYGALSGKTLLVLRALLWTFHNSRTGLLYPSYDAIAAAAHVSRRMVHIAITALEEAGLLAWHHRLTRVKWHCPYGSGWRWRVLRTSNNYRFSAECKTSTGTKNQDFKKEDSRGLEPLSLALLRLEGRVKREGRAAVPNCAPSNHRSGGTATVKL